MLNIITDENDALDALKAECAPTVDPTLDEANELLPILRKCQIAQVWAASTAYPFGSTVIPTANNRNGLRFKLVRLDGSGVSSGATEPSWPCHRDATVTDGNLTWQVDGIECSLWEMRRALYLAWDLKVKKATACGVDFRTPSLQVSNSQLITNLKEQRDRFRPITIA
jgi:hypothetical protein